MKIEQTDLPCLVKCIEEPAGQLGLEGFSVDEVCTVEFELGNIKIKPSHPDNFSQYTSLEALNRFFVKELNVTKNVFAPILIGVHYIVVEDKTEYYEKGNRFSIRYNKDDNTFTLFSDPKTDKKLFGMKPLNDVRHDRTKQEVIEILNNVTLSLDKPWALEEITKLDSKIKQLKKDYQL